MSHEWVPTVVQLTFVWTHPGEGEERQPGHSCEHEGGNQHDQSHQDIVAEVGHGSQPTTEGENKVKERAEPTFQPNRPTDTSTPVQTSASSGVFMVRDNSEYYVFKDYRSCSR